jgi:hypothetical protein
VACADTTPYALIQAAQLIESEDSMSWDSGKFNRSAMFLQRHFGSLKMSVLTFFFHWRSLEIPSNATTRLAPSPLALHSLTFDGAD